MLFNKITSAITIVLAIFLHRIEAYGLSCHGFEIMILSLPLVLDSIIFKIYDELKQEFSHLEKVRNFHTSRLKTYRKRMGSKIIVGNHDLLFYRTQRKLDGVERRQRKLGYQLYRIIISK